MTANIRLEIVADNPAEMAGIIAAMAAVQRLSLRGDGAAAPAEAPDENPSETAETTEPVEAEPKRHGRRKKKEEPVEETAVPEAEAEDAPAEEPSAAPAATEADVKAAMDKLISFGGAGGTAIVNVLTEFGAVNADGLPRRSALKPEKYGEAVEKMNAVIAELEASGDDPAELMG